MRDMSQENWVYGGAFVAGLAVIAVVQSVLWSRAPADCSLETFGGDAAAAWNNREHLAHSACYQKLFRDLSDLDVSQQAARDMEEMLARDHPRRGYKIGGHDPSMWDVIGLPGPMFGVIYGEDAFIELPLLLGDPDELKDGFIYPFLMQATNLGARHGVIGEYP